MGISIGRIASPLITSFDINMLGNLLRCKLQEIDARLIENSGLRFDVHNKGDVDVVYGLSHLCILNRDVSDELLFDEDRRFYEHFLSMTGMRGKVVFFCLYESGNSYGFAMFENGRAIRHRLFSLGCPEPRRVVHGTPLTVEQLWHPATLTDSEKRDFDPEEHDKLFRHEESRQLLGEHSLNSHFVDAVLKAKFGWSPFHNTDKSQSYRAL